MSASITELPVFVAECFRCGRVDRIHHNNGIQAVQFWRICGWTFDPPICNWCNNPPSED